jgi:hypothetical protein
MQDSEQRGRGASLCEWKPPRLGRISLVAEEVLGIGCKSEQVSTRGWEQATCIIRPCSTKGS